MYGYDILLAIIRSKLRLLKRCQQYANKKGLIGLHQGLNGLSGSYWSALGLASTKCCLQALIYVGFV